jgi:hypothetical protein
LFPVLTTRLGAGDFLDKGFGSRFVLKGVPIGDRVQLVAVGEPADYLIRDDEGSQRIAR